MTMSALLSTVATVLPPVNVRKNADATPALQRLIFGESGISDTAIHTDGLFMMIQWFSLFCFVVLMTLMVYWVIKYRRKPGVPPPVSPSHNTLLEIAWTIVPSASMLVMFVLGFFGYMDKMVPHGDAIELNVRAQMWSWDITYPNGSQTPWMIRIDDDPETGIQGKEYPLFVVPSGGHIELRMISQDVIHSLWIPDLRTKMDVYPNRYSGFVFTVPTLEIDETYRDMWVFCAEFCGDFHSQMAALFRIVPADEYEQIVNEEWTQGVPPVELGERIWKQKCQICHSIDGTPGTGPTWKGYEGGSTGFGYPVTFSDGTSIETRDENYIRNSLLDPQGQVVPGYAGTMPPFDGLLSETQINGIIAFYKAQSDLAPPSEEVPAEDDAADDTAEDTNPGSADGDS